MLFDIKKRWVEFVVAHQEQQRLPCKNFVFIFRYDSFHIKKTWNGERSSILSQNWWCEWLRARFNKIWGWEGELGCVDGGLCDVYGEEVLVNGERWRVGIVGARNVEGHDFTSEVLRCWGRETLHRVILGNVWLFKSALYLSHLCLLETSLFYA